MIAQHMPGRFTEVFANRINKISALEVVEVVKPMPLTQGFVYIAHGDADMKMIRRANTLMLSSVPSDPDFLWHPSVEVLVRSVHGYIEARNIICVQLTGMGNDGAQAMAELHQQGARTIAESEETAIVYGMPRELVKMNGADRILPSYKIADQLVKWLM